MADTTLQNRLRQHAQAFDGLLSLIPAKMYYGNGDDPNKQWQKKKKRPEEKRAARLANLDPDNDLNKSVKEIMDERAARNKRKLGEMQEDGNDDDEPIDGVQKEGPGQVLNKQTDNPNKKKKLSDELDNVSERKPSKKEEKKLLHKQKKLEKKVEQKTALAERAAAEREDDGSKSARQKPQDKTPQPETSEQLTSGDAAVVQSDKDQPLPSVDDEKNEETQVVDELANVNFSGLAPTEEAPGASSQASSPVLSSPNSPTFDSLHPAKDAADEPGSTTTSISSTVPPSERPKHIKLPTDPDARARLAAKLAAMRAARKADEKPIRTRQELIEARREQEAKRKAHKKELRRKAKEEEERKREEALASARTSPGSIMSPLIGIGSPEEGPANQFAFGRVAFGDGTQMSHDLSYVKDGKKKKGSAGNDAKAHLAKLEAQKMRISGLDEDKRKEVLEKETWLAARRKAEGEKIRDNESLLKKAVKRKEKAKKKSEREWNDRIQGVEKSMKDRQKKREENIRKRKEGKTAGKAKKKGVKVNRGRAGFEGRFGGGGRRK